MFDGPTVPAAIAPPVRWLIVNELIDYDGPVVGDSKTLHPIGSDWSAWVIPTSKYTFEFVPLAGSHGASL